MTAPKIIFFILAAVIIGFSVLAVTSRRILRAAIFLLFMLVAVAGLFYMMNFAFLAAVQLILYGGGIVVLIIYSILLTNQINSKLDPPKILNGVLAGLVTISGAILFLKILLPWKFVASPEPALTPDMRQIGLQLLGTGRHGYVLPFELIGILLLAALVGSIYIALKNRI